MTLHGFYSGAEIYYKSILERATLTETQLQVLSFGQKFCLLQVHKIRLGDIMYV